MRRCHELNIFCLNLQNPHERDGRLRGCGRLDAGEASANPRAVKGGAGASWLLLFQVGERCGHKFGPAREKGGYCFGQVGETGVHLLGHWFGQREERGGSLVRPSGGQRWPLVRPGGRELVNV